MGKRMKQLVDQTIDERRPAFEPEENWEEVAEQLGLA